MKFKLLEEDSEIIKSLIGELGTSQKDLAKRLGYVSLPLLNKRLCGITPISQLELTNLFNELGKDDSVKFLLDYEDRLSTPALEDIEKGWILTYEQYSFHLRKNYLALPIEERHKVLKDLEKLTDKYSQESDK